MLARLASLTLLATLVPAAHGQIPAKDYDFHWAPLANPAQIAIPDQVLFGSALGIPPGTSLGGAIRRCYSVDVTQGGRNESGSYETNFITFAQGWGSAGPTPGVQVGLVSIRSATDSDLGGDACLSPWFSSVGNTGGHEISVVTLPGLIPGTAAAPFPSVWQSTYQWLGTTTQFAGLPGANTLGVDSNGLPLLANVIYEIQGPINAGFASTQYYMATTNEVTGLSPASAPPGRGTGGVTNGNSIWGSSIFGTTADVSGAVSHSRVLGLSSTFGLTATTPWWGPTPGSGELNGHVSFGTPFLWARNNGSQGAGGPDWTIASGTPSMVQVQLKDIKSGGQANQDVLWKIGGGGVPSAAYDPTLVINQAVFFWSTSPATSMQQLPMSWDDLGGAAPPKAGSYLLSTPVARNSDLAGGGVLTQSLPVNFDPLTMAMLATPGLSMGTSFTWADAPGYDAVPPGLTAFNEGMFSPAVSGISNLSMAGGNDFPVAPAPIPSLGGLNIGVAALTLQARTGGPLGLTIEVAEVASALTITLQ